MKKILVLLVLTLGIFTIASAQRGTGERPSKARPERGMRMDPKERIEKQTARMQEELELTDEQTADIKALMLENMEARQAEMEKRRAEMEEAQEQQKMDFEKMRAEMKAQRDAQNEQIKAMLTKEQAEKYDAMLKEQEERMKERMSDGPPPPPPLEGEDEGEE